MGKNLDILNKIVSDKPSGWLEDAKRRQKYSFWYDLKFYIQLKWIIIKQYFKRV